MKNIFPGHFRPTKDEFDKLWENAIFVVDANVILNLYRYSSKTRNELQRILSTINHRIFIPHQAAEEFLRNRLVVTSEQSDEYTSTIKEIDKIVNKISNKDRHPFIEEETTTELEAFAEKIKRNLKDQQDSLLRKLTNDEILDFVASTFEKNTGQPYTKDELDRIINEGTIRYESKIPPGYKDVNKENPSFPHRKFGDLIVWYQTIDHSKTSNKPIIFITDDKKEDWWLEQSGRTIGPRPELIEEFKRKSGNDFWMYTVSRFVEEHSERHDKSILGKLLDDILNEINSVSTEVDRQKNIQTSYLNKRFQSSISIEQTPETEEHTKNEGYFTINLSKNMRYATGSGKFIPELIFVPDFHASIISSPEGMEKNNMKISFGCGTTKDFHIHIKGLNSELIAGDYVFHYEADCDDSIFFEEDDNDFIKQKFDD